MIRKTVLATAIIGAGLGSMTGAAFAGDDPGSSGHNWDNDHGHSRHHDDSDNAPQSSCTNNVAAVNKSENGGLVDVLGGAQTIIPVNACDILNGNSVLSGNHLG